MRWLGISWRCSLVCLAAACGGGSDGGTGPGGDNLTGTYQLVGADGAAVPTVVLSDVCDPTQIQSGSLRLTGDGGFEMRFDWQEQGSPPEWTGDHGRYRYDDGDLLFSSEAWGDQFEGEIDDGLLYLYYDFCSDGRPADLSLAFAR